MTEVRPAEPRVEPTIPQLHERAVELCELLYGCSYGKVGTTHDRLRVAHIALSHEGNGLFPVEAWERPQLEMHFGVEPEGGTGEAG